LTADAKITGSVWSVRFSRIQFNYALYYRSRGHDVSILLCVGCYIGNLPSNKLLYADDIVLLSPALRAQQILLNMYGDILTDLSMKFNIYKSVRIIPPPYKTSGPANDNFPSFKLDGQNMWAISYLQYLYACLSVCLTVCLFFCLSVCMFFVYLTSVHMGFMPDTKIHTYRSCLIICCSMTL